MPSVNLIVGMYVYVANGSIQFQVYVLYITQSKRLHIVEWRIWKQILNLGDNIEK